MDVKQLWKQSLFSMIAPPSLKDAMKGSSQLIENIIGTPFTLPLELSLNTRKRFESYWLEFTVLNILELALDLSMKTWRCLDPFSFIKYTVLTMLKLPLVLYLKTWRRLEGLIKYTVYTTLKLSLELCLKTWRRLESCWLIKYTFKFILKLLPLELCLNIWRRLESSWLIKYTVRITLKLPLELYLKVESRLESLMLSWEMQGMNPKLVIPKPNDLYE